MNKLSNFTKGILSALVMALCFSSIGILGILVYRGGAGPLTLLTGRAVIAGLLFFLTFLVLKRGAFDFEKKDIPRLVAHSGILIFHLLCWWQALRMLEEIAVAYALFFTFPLWTFLIGIWGMKKKIKKYKIASLFLGILGILFIIQFLPNISIPTSISGVGLMLLAAATWAIYISVGEVLLKKYNLFKILFYNFLACFIVFLSINGIGTTLSELSLPVIIYIVILGIVVTYLAYLFNYFAIKRIEATTVSIVHLTVPFFGTLLAFIVLGQVVTSLQFMGMVLLAISIYLLYK